MIITTRRKKFMRVADVFFSDGVISEQPEADVVQYVQTSKSGPGFSPFHTLVVDLTVPKEEIFARFERNTRYEINRATKQDGLQAALLLRLEAGTLEEFRDYYDAFAAVKKLPACNLEKLVALNRAGALAISRVWSEDGRLLSYHAYVTDGGRARLLYSATHSRLCGDSAIRAMMGRANRYLHWQDIILFQAQGFTRYDLGGISDGSDPETKGIDNFKRGFGGEEVTEYNAVQGISLLGKLACRLMGRLS